MIEKLVFLAALVLAQGKPQVEDKYERKENCERNALCPEDQRHYLLPHEYDCTKFYYCEYGMKWELPRDCAPGTQFSFKLQVCIHPTLANCTLPGSPTKPITTTTTTTTTRAPTTTTTTTTPDPTTTTTTTTSTTQKPTTTTSTTTSSTESDDCLLENGCPADFNVHKLLPHETECNKFYYCVHGQKVERQCAPGTYFNATLQVCDWPHNVECAGSVGGDGGSGGAGGGNLPNGCPADFGIHKLLPHETNCSKFYYCVFGNKVERECPLNTHFNPTLQVCDWPKNAGCANNAGDNGSNDGGDAGNGVGGSGGENCAEGANCGGGSGGGSGGGGNENDIDQGELLPNGCPSDFDIHKLLPHETDCDKFYYCVFGEKVERTCAPGTHFNPLLQVCDWPENAGCATNGGVDGGSGGGSGGDGWSGGAGGGEGGSSGGGDEDGGSGGEGGGDLVSGGGGGDGSSGGGENCGGDNSGGGNCEEGESCSGGSGGGGNENDVSEGEMLPNGCPSDFDIHKLLPHETDCDKFYYCVFGEKVERTCAPGTHFNPLLQVCDWPKNAGCATNGSGDGGSGGGGGGDGGSGEGDNGDGGSSGEGGEDGSSGVGDGGDLGSGGGGSGNGSSGGAESSGEDSSGGGNCGEGESGGGGSGGGGNENDVDQGELLPNGCPSDFDIHKLLPHETDCDKFYYCVFGEKVERTCAPGTHFNPLLQVCDWPENAGCATNGGGDGGSGGGGGGDGGSIGGGGGDEGSKNKCEVGCNVLPWPHENDCDKYWRCDGSTAVLVLCSEGLHFNPKTFTCDFICNVSCSRRDVESTALADGLKVFLPWDKMNPRLARMYLNNNMNL